MKIAVTGRIGSGKSVVLSEVKRLGAFVLSADEINRSLLNSKNYLDKLKSTFPEAFQGDVFDKKALTSLVFQDESKRKLLNEIAHPEIFKVIGEQIEGKDKVFVEIPLLSLEWAKLFDAVWVIKSSSQQRLERVKLRDKRDEEQIKLIFDSQKCYDELKYENEQIFTNDEGIENLLQKVRGEFRKI